MRALCNVAYATRAEGLDEKELLELNDELELELGAKPRGRSSGTSALMGAMRMPRR